MKQRGEWLHCGRTVLHAPPQDVAGTHAVPEQVGAGGGGRGVMSTSRAGR